MIAPLAWLGRRARGSLALGVVLALALPALSHALRPLLPAAVLGLLVVATVRTDHRSLIRLARPARLVVLSVLMLVATPVLVWLIAGALALPSALASAMVLGASLPPLLSVPAIAVVMGLDVALALNLVMITTVVAPFTLAPVALLLLGLDLAISPSALMLRLAALVLGALALGALLRRWLGARRIDDLDAPLSGVMVLLLLLFAVAIMDGVPAAFADDPMRAALFVLAAFGLNLGLQALAIVGLWPLGRRAALTVGFANGNRSLGLLLAVLPATADPEIGLFLALGQFPIYVLPYLVAGPYRRLLTAAAARHG